MASQLPPFSAPTANSLEPFVIEISNDPDLDLDVALSHWAQPPACDLDELYPNLQPALTPLSQDTSTQSNWILQPPARSPSETRTYKSLSQSAAAAAAPVVHLQCLPGHEFAGGAHAGTPSVVMQAHSVASVKFKSTAAPSTLLLAGECLSAEPMNHMDHEELLLYPLLPGLVPASPTGGYTSTAAAFDSSAATTYNVLHALEWNRVNDAIPLSPPAPSSMNRNDTKFMEEMSSTKYDDGSQVTLRVKTESINLADGFTWRKYGEKVIKETAFKKSYFRCVRHHKGCKVRKRIQRCSDDKNYIDFTYVGRHNHPP